MADSNDKGGTYWRDKFWESKAKSARSTSNHWLAGSIFKGNESSIWDDLDEDDTSDFWSDQDTGDLPRRYTSRYNGAANSRGYGGYGYGYNVHGDGNGNRPNVATSKYDTIQLAQFQRAIANFVYILTQDPSIDVQYISPNADSCTNGKTVWIAPKLDEGKFDQTVGLALHEASHIQYTNFPVLNNWLIEHRILVSSPASKWNQFPSMYMKLQKTVFNIVEDLYIDALTFKAAPGYRGYYQALYHEFYDGEFINKTFTDPNYRVMDFDSYIFHVCNIRNPKRDLSALPGLNDIWKMLDLQHILRLDTQSARTNLAEAITTRILNEIEFDAQQELKSSQASREPTQQEIEDYLQQLLEKTEASRKGAPGQLDAILKQINFLVDPFLNKEGELSTVESMAVNTMSKLDVEVKEVNVREYNREAIKTYIIREVTPAFMANYTLCEAYGIRLPTDQSREDRVSDIRDAVNQGKILAKRLQLRSEERVVVNSRLNAGKIDKRLLSQIGYGSYDIFQKTQITAYDPSFIHISIDASGSMSYRNYEGGDDRTKFEHAMHVAATIATAAVLVRNIHVVVSLRSTVHASGRRGTTTYNQIPYIMYVFDSRKDNLEKIQRVFPRLIPTALTPEGICFDAIMSDIQSMSAGKDAYFINVCDGQPFYVRDNTSYEGSLAVEHSKRQRVRMENLGVKVLGYFVDSTFQSQSDFNAFQTIYGIGNSTYLKSSKDLSLITKTLNKKLLQD